MTTVTLIKAGGIACFDKIDSAFAFAAQHNLTIPAQARVVAYNRWWALQRVPDGLYFGPNGQVVILRSRDELSRERGAEAGHDLAQRFARLTNMDEQQRALAVRMASSWWTVHSHEGDHFNAGMLEALGLGFDQSASGTWTIVPK